MSASCHDSACSESAQAATGRYRRVLIIALIANLAMFFVEIATGAQAGSLSLWADALDFFGDAANFAVSLWVLSMTMVWRSGSAMVKGAVMFGFGLFILYSAVAAVQSGVTPEPLMMGWVGLLALATNVGVALMLYRYREGDANMRGVWLCTRNDAFGNIAVMFAALGVFGTGSAWPDILVAVTMAGLSLQGGFVVMRQALGELRTPANLPKAADV